MIHPAKGSQVALEGHRPVGETRQKGGSPGVISGLMEDAPQDWRGVLLLNMWCSSSSHFSV